MTRQERMMYWQWGETEMDELGRYLEDDSEGHGGRKREPRRSLTTPRLPAWQMGGASVSTGYDML